MDYGPGNRAGSRRVALSVQFTEVEGEPGNRFDLKTTGLGTGTWALQVRVGSAGPTSSVEFRVR